MKPRPVLACAGLRLLAAALAPSTRPLDWSRLAAMLVLLCLVPIVAVAAIPDADGSPNDDPLTGGGVLAGMPEPLGCRVAPPSSCSASAESRDRTLPVRQPSPRFLSLRAPPAC